MKIAIPTNDRLTVATRTGRCKEFLIAEINADDVKLNYVKNTHTHNHDHSHNHSQEEHKHSHSEIVDALDGVDLLLLLNIGKNLKRDIEEGKISYKKTSETNIEKIISEYRK